MPEDDERPTGWLESVTLAGSDTPVRVTVEERGGNRVLLRQVDPGEPEPERVPIHPGDQIVVMQAISHVGLHTTDVEGSVADLITSMRVVPVRREHGVVYARTLRRGEEDTGRRVHVRPGESLTLEAGAVAVELDAIDEREPATSSGHVPLTPVLSTWFAVGHENTDLARVRYLLAAARRLDVANVLLMQVEVHRSELEPERQPGPNLRRAFLALIGAVEMAIVALGRAVDMVKKAKTAIECDLQVPEAVSEAMAALIEIRNAYEHIEDRAQGQVRGQPHPDALTIFDYRELIEHDRIRYGQHELDLVEQVPKLLGAVRQFLKNASAND